jgi:ComF family protein
MQSSGKIKIFFDLIFSPHCMICGKRIEDTRENWICPACLSQVAYISSPFCPRCGLPFVPETGSNHFCQVCLTSSPFFGTARALGKYEEGLKEAITKFKYQEKIILGENLGRLMAEILYPDLIPGTYDLFVPVPLHPKRLRERGFNQAAVLASQLSRWYQVPLDPLNLRRNRPTESQIHLDFKERRKNVKGAFSVKHEAKVNGKSILLIDDVYTSGATVNECAKVLRKAGAERVDVLTLARAF